MLAQVPGLPQTDQPRPGQLTPFATGQSAQYRPCTPAEYGDPAADCIPANRRSGYSGGYDDPRRLDFTPGWEGTDDQLVPGILNGRGRDQFGDEIPRPTNPTYVEKEPPTEFQRYVAGSIGRILPIFGASLFDHVPATFAPLERVPVSADYVIAPGDELQVAVWGQFNFSRRLIVSRTGEVVLPDAGPVSVAGLQYGQAASVLKSAMSRLYKNFDLSITMGRLHSIQIFVVGEARRPGSYTVSSMSTLVNAIFSSGGPSSRGSMRSIQLKRGSQIVRELDLYELLVRGDKSNDAQLVPGDVILIPAAGPRVAVAGSVEHPAIYEMKANSTIGDAIRLADGLSPLASTNNVVLERVVDGSALKVLRLPLNSQGLETPLCNGDLVRLMTVVPRFENAVTLRGNVADSGRFPWHEGMRLSELIPDKQSLLTRDYWQDRNALIASRDMTASDTSFSTSNPDSASRADGADKSSDRQAMSVIGGTRTAPVTYREEKRNIQGDGSLGAAMGLDEIPPLRNFTPRNTVQPSAPDINWEYAIVERMDETTLATRIIPFNLGKLVLSHDASQDLLLQPRDVVTIFSKADFSVPHSQQAKQVRLEGEIGMAGVYTVHPGETLRQLVARAGGLTPNAYLYGAQFTRESTRREQQKRYDDFLNQFDREMSEAASNLSSRVTSPQQAATAQTSLASQHDLIERLRKVSMNGRIVLDMDPTSRGELALPDLPLENGDRLYVPSRPLTVNVIGTVFEQAAFLHEEDLRVRDYLKKSGGPARSADRTHMFVIRADGSVISRNAGVALFAKGFDTLPMYPGDTLVVPTYINRTTFVRNLMDWSQVFSNLALGAAAINVLH
jgi:polysaccharide biosynthesis/export protein